MSDEDEDPAEPERDPFGRLEASAGDRKGDPFEALSGPDEDDGIGGDPESEAATGDDPHTDDTATGTATDDATSAGSAGQSPEKTADSAADASGPQNTADTAAEVQEVSEPRVRPGSPAMGDDAADAAVDRGDPFAGESPFTQMDVGEIDEDHVWQQLADAQARGSVREASERDYADVSKHSYCERCEYFSEPPNVGCSHEGTEILEFVDAETVRVVDCPIVAERRSLQRGSDSE